MNHFDNRNILDRMESTWNIIIKNWKAILIPPIVIWAGCGLLLLILCFSGFIVFYSDISALISTAHENIYELLLLFLWVFLLVLIFITYVQAYLSTYIYMSVDGREENTRLWFAEIHTKTLSRIWSWFWYIFWYSLILIVLIFFCWVFAFIHFESIYFTAPLFILVFIWLTVWYTVGMPHYIIEGKSTFRDYIKVYTLTQWRWWRIFGNILWSSIIIGSAIQVWNMIVTIPFSSLQISLSETFTQASQSIAPMEYILSILTSNQLIYFMVPLIVTILLQNIQKVFQAIFYYTISVDLRTTEEETK